MLVRALRTIRNDAGTIRRGQTAEVSDQDAKSLLARGLAEKVEPIRAEKSKAKAKSSVAATEAGTAAVEGE